MKRGRSPGPMALVYSLHPPPAFAIARSRLLAHPRASASLRQPARPLEKGCALSRRDRTGSGHREHEQPVEVDEVQAGYNVAQDAVEQHCLDGQRKHSSTFPSAACFERAPERCAESAQWALTVTLTRSRQLSRPLPEAYRRLQSSAFSIEQLRALQRPPPKARLKRRSLPKRHALDYAYAESGECRSRVRLALAPPRGVTRQPCHLPPGGRARRADASPKL
eukprot:scaffold39571_cov70-Phaeocystis_antarctica.AAC.6